MADIATIVSIFLALGFFIHDGCTNKIKDRNEYINQLEAIDFELDLNTNLANYIVDNEEGYSIGEHFPYGKFFFVDTLNDAIIKGKIKNSTLRLKFYEILQRENEINYILDSADKKQTILAGSDKGVLIEQNPYKHEMSIIIKDSKDLQDMFHKARTMIVEHKQSVEKTYGFCDFLI